MNMRHAGVLSALLLTAALLCAMPGLLRTPQTADRTAEILRPSRLRTMTVWLLPGNMGDRKLINGLCAAFEKERSGVRVFVRVVTAEEFEGENAVLPDVALFQTGEITAPERFFCALEEQNAPSGIFAGVQRAVPLWLAPNVLSLPQGWLGSPDENTQRRDSLLAAATPAPQTTDGQLLTEADLPWGMLLQKGALAVPEGVGWQQLLMACPQQLRARLVNAVLGTAHPSSEPPAETGEWVTTLPMTRTATPTPMPAITMPARVETLAAYRQSAQNGANVTAFMLQPAVSDRVRYAAICREGEDAQAFVRFLLDHQEEAAAYALLPAGTTTAASDELTRQLMDAYQNAVLPNAFAHTREEIGQLCMQAFARCEDPVHTLLTLR